MSDIKYKIRRIKQMNIKELTKLISKKFYYQYKKIELKVHPIETNNKYIESFKTESISIIDANNREKYIDALINLNINIKKQIISEADNICKHNFNLLGSGERPLGERIAWNCDFKSGYSWSNDYYKNIRFVNFGNDADIKIPWELSRFQHIFTLGKAYWLTNDEKYALEFAEEIKDWIEKNPVKMTINWTCTMDVAIRAVNWIIGYFFFYKSPKINKDFWEGFNKWLYYHGEFIIKNLENKGTHTGNHYLSNIVGLVWLGIYFRNINEVGKGNRPKEWLKFAIEEFEKEMFVQVNEDGTDYEASTSYHRLVTELFLITVVLCEKNHIYFSKDFLMRLEKMCVFLMNITKPNGLSPIIGDADDGRLIIISNYSSWVKNDFRHLLAIAGEYFDRDDFRYYGLKYKEDALWVMGEFKDPTSASFNLSSIAFRNGGYYILRNDRIYCCIRCGELSFRGEGTHSHNDQLSIELNIDGKDYIIDPGSYIYSADYKMRNKFRSTEMHNSVLINGYEQNEFDEFNLFYMQEQTYAECIEFSTNKFVGQHYGYKEQLGIVHRRTIKLEKGKVIVIDEIIGDTANEILSTLNLHPHVFVDAHNGILSLSQDNAKIMLHYINNFITEKSEVSFKYGEKISSNRLLIPIKPGVSSMEISLT